MKMGLAQGLRGGAIIEVTNAGEAKIAESAGACCIIITEKVETGILRMPDPCLVKEIKRVVSIPVMAKVRVGHFVEGQILEAVEIDSIDESEVVGVADEDRSVRHNSNPLFLSSTPKFLKKK